MPSRSPGSPILMAFLRSLAFVGITESIFYRLLPEPLGGAGPLSNLHASLNRAGGFTFFLAFFLVVAAIINVAYRTLRLKFWPGRLNGVLAVCMLCLAALGFSAVAMERGPAFAIVFTLLALLTTLLVAMHAFATAATGWARVFAVSYCGALLSSAVGTIARFQQTLASPGGARANLPESAVAAGEILLAAAGVFSFMAYFDVDRKEVRGSIDKIAFLLGALAALGFAVGSLLAPDRLALLGPDPGALRVLLLSCALFLGTMTATACLLDPARRLQGYGLLLLLIAGYPLRIAYQHLLVVLGSALLFAPAPKVAAAPPRVDFVPFPRTPIAPEPAPEPAAEEHI